jgi:hypothetical protein
MSSWTFRAPAPREPPAPRDPPTFSIAIAAYEAAATAGEAVESALGQTVPPREVVVCDDGSSDDLAAALAPYGGRIVLLRQPNRGEAAAKNAAARATSSEFVAFLDADDLYHPQRLEALAELAAVRPDLDVLTTNAELEVDGRIVGRYYEDVASFPVDDQVEGVIAHDSAVFSAAAVRRSAFDAAGGLHEALRSSGDWELWLRLVLGGSRIGLVAEPLYRYRVHERGASADQVGGAWDCVAALERAAEVALPQGREREALDRSLVHHRAAALLAEAEAALRRGRASGRRAAGAVAGARDLPLQTRLKGAFAWVAPSLAATLLERRERKSGRSRLRKPIPGR